MKYSITSRLNFSACRSLLFAAAFLSCAAARAQVFTTASGVVYFEAEAYTSSIARSGLAWEQTNTIAGFSGTGYMAVTNDATNNLNAGITTTSPELQYAVNFTIAGTYRIWARGYPMTGNDDSIHLGLDGVPTATSSNLTWAPVTNTWVWTNITAGGAARTITVGATGLHTFNMWMREDGTRVDRFVLATDVNFKAVIGNSFHIPSSTQADLNSGGFPTMRFPLQGITSNTAVRIFTGNQFQGPGNPGNQLGTGSAVFYRNATNTAWTEVAMQFYSTGTINTNNKFYVGIIPSNTFHAGDVVQYYVRIPYSDHLPTYAFGNDDGRQETELESVAQADPFSYTVQWPLAAAGPYVSITNSTAQGDVEARLYTDSGHISVVGPDLSGNPLTNAIAFAPPSAKVGSETHSIGAVLSSIAISNGLEFVQKIATTSITSRLTFTGEGVARYEIVNWSGLLVQETYITAPSDSSEHFFGLGEKFNAVDQAGKNVHMLTWDPAGDKGDRSYKCVPWYLSTRGYGFHLDSTAESYFDLHATAADRVSISNFFSTLKFNVVYGPRLADVLTRYTGYSGRPAMSPAWAYAPWMSSDKWRTGGEIRYVVTEMLARDIPGSVFVFDSPWATSYNDFNWNMTQFSLGFTNAGTPYAGFSSVSDMMNFLRTNGYKAVCWMTPFVNKTSVNPEGVAGLITTQATTYAFASNNGYFVRSGSTNGQPLVAPWWKGDGSPVDFTKPEAAAWWMLQLSNLVAQSGDVIGGFKTDDGETSNGSDIYIPTNAWYADGRSGLEMRNGYCVEYHRTVWNVLRTNGLLFARSGFTGSHSYPGYWSGDNAPNFTQENGLLSVIVAGQSAGLSGFSIWASDIGGYQVNNSPAADTNNLFMRWTQFGAFSPLFQMHRQTDKNNYYPWNFSPAAVANYRSYAKLHVSLFPYIYTYAFISSTNGLPIIRHPVLFNQTDTGTYGLNHTYYFGEELLVAPATAEGQTQRNVYLPAGLWYDFWTNRAYAGGQNISWTNFDQSKMGLFVRSGAIIPMVSSNIDTLVDSTYMGHTNIVTLDSALEFLTYPATNSSFTIYDGTAATCSSNDTVVTFNLTSASRPISLRVYNGEPSGVERDGIRLLKYTNAATFAAASLGWRYDNANGFVLVKLDHGGGSTTIKMGPDTIGDGIPNSWRENYFGSATSTDALSCATCDPDGDGHNNLQEYRAGTNPNDATSLLKVQDEDVQFGPTAITIAWPSRPGIPYTVGWKNDAADSTPWNSVTSQFTGNGNPLNWSDNGSETGSAPSNSPTGRRFYRVEVP